MAVLFRYLAREIYGATAMVLVAFLGLFMFFDFINELEDVGTASYQLPQAIVYVLLILPGRAYELPWLHLFTFRSGRVTRIYGFCDSHGLMQALRDEA